MSGDFLFSFFFFFFSLFLLLCVSVSVPCLFVGWGCSGRKRVSSFGLGWAGLLVWGEGGIFYGGWYGWARTVLMFGKEARVFCDGGEGICGGYESWVGLRR